MQTMENSSLGQALANLLIGLTKGARSLEPYASEFKELGYRPHLMDKPFSIGDSMVSPDIALCSETVGNTMLVDWQEGGLSDRKASQASRYARITTNNITFGAAVPAAAAVTHGVTIMAPSGKCQEVVDFVAENEYGFSVVACDHDGNAVTLVSRGGSFSEPTTDAFFSRALTFEDVPSSYVPFPPEHFKYEHVVAPLAVHAFTRVVAGSADFRVPEFCETCFVDVWHIMSKDAKRKMEKHAKTVLLHLAGYTISNQRLVYRVKQKPTVFGVVDLKKNRANHLVTIRAHLPRFIAFAEGNPNRQLGFEF